MLARSASFGVNALQRGDARGGDRSHCKLRTAAYTVLGSTPALPKATMSQRRIWAVAHGTHSVLATMRQQRRSKQTTYDPSYLGDERQNSLRLTKFLTAEQFANWDITVVFRCAE